VGILRGAYLLDRVMIAVEGSRLPVPGRAGKDKEGKKEKKQETEIQNKYQTEIKPPKAARLRSKSEEPKERENEKRKITGHWRSARAASAPPSTPQNQQHPAGI